MGKFRRISIRDVAISALFLALFFLASNLIPPIQLAPGIPITLQVAVVLLMGAFLGLRHGLLTIAGLYLLTLAGIPMMSGFTAAAALWGPTAGFIWGFAFMVMLMGIYHDFFADRFGTILDSVLFIGFAVGSILLNYICGALWVCMLSGSYVIPTFFGMFVFFIPDLIKAAVALLVYKKAYLPLRQFS